jgi:hypothetical protein
MLACVALGTGLRSASASAIAPTAPGSPRVLFTELLNDWGAGLLRMQIQAPGDSTRHGALACPACSFIHGRCLDALYPFLHVARTTGDTRYVAAAQGVYNWAELNVSRPDGSWTVISDPTSWNGVSIFGAIALADALRYHGDLLDAATRLAWTERLRRVARYIHGTMTIGLTNINYPATATHGLYLFGTMLDEPAYCHRARELAREVMPFFTAPNALLSGEAKPATARSARLLPGVDLGYNVEESLVALALYARDSGDRECEEAVVSAWRGHLAFMLPDGGWDNSWGSRQAKWSYWGSRTSAGCQPGLAVLADRDPAFATAAIRNTELMRACTRDGLLYGGPHYAAAGAPPCVHHTFTHAKAVAAVLDRGGLIDDLAATAPLPRATADGVHAVPELAVWLIARGPWRATVSAYDFLYRKDTCAATGGTLGILWHERVGPVFAASMSHYVRTEANNMQDDPAGRDDPLTPRVETWRDGVRFSQMHDLAPSVTVTESAGAIAVEVLTRLTNQAQQDPVDGAVHCRVSYRVGREAVVIRAALAVPPAAGAAPVRLVLPVIARPGEAADKAAGGQRWRVARAGGNLLVESRAGLAIGDAPERGWIFNLTPGFAAVPLVLAVPADGSPVEATLRVLDQGVL